MDKNKLIADMYWILLDLKDRYYLKDRKEDEQTYIRDELLKLTTAGMEWIAEDEREKQNDLLNNQD